MRGLPVVAVLWQMQRLAASSTTQARQGARRLRFLPGCEGATRRCTDGSARPPSTPPPPPARHRGRGARVLQPARHTSLFSLSLTVSDLLSQDSRVRSRQLRAVPPPPSCRVPFERWCLLVSVHQLVIVASCSLVSLWLPACISSAPWAQRDQHTLGVFGEGTACWEKELWSGE